MEDITCPICIENLKHTFHVECIALWLSLNDVPHIHYDDRLEMSVDLRLDETGPLGHQDLLILLVHSEIARWT